MQIAPGSWIIEAMRAAPERRASPHDRVARVESAREPTKPGKWDPPSAQGRGVLIDLIV